MLNLVNNAENSSEVTIFVVNMSNFFYYRNASSTDKLNNVFVITYMGNAVKTIYKIIFFNVDNNIYIVCVYKLITLKLIYIII